MINAIHRHSNFTHFFVSLNGEDVFSTKDKREADMFYAELKGRLKIAEERGGGDAGGEDWNGQGDNL